MSPILYIGNACIGLSFAFSLLGTILFFVSRRVESDSAAWWGRAMVYGNFVLMTAANLAMIYALLHNDFGVSYVAHVGSVETPRWISAISLWSSLEGSILFWGWILATYSAACIYIYRNSEKMLAWVGLVLLVVQIFFTLLLALPANPFQVVVPPPANGPGPNPLLQNHWLMAIHPPCLYIGYIGFTIPFAFAVAALLEKDFSGFWLQITRRWTLFAWSFLSMAIVLGGWWSYAVLGWGGYWAWDPVENASFMPWLTGTALLHSMMVQEKRKMLPVWNLFLALLTFLLTILGTFLTRSGVLESVHSFTQSDIGPYFVVFIGVALAVSLILLLWRGAGFQYTFKIESLFSLEVLFLFNNLLFLSFCFVVFVGTLYPLVVEAIRGQRISVGEPYFNQMTMPIAGMILLLMGIGLLTPWKKGIFKNFLNQAKIPALLSLLMTVIAGVLGVRHLMVVVVILLASFAFLVMVFEIIRLSPQHSFFKLLKLNPKRYGGFIAHTGVLIIMVAVALSKTAHFEKEMTLQRGDSAEAHGYLLTLKEIEAVDVSHRFEVRALIEVTRNGKVLETLAPRMNYYSNSREPVGSPAVRSTLKEDLYLTLISVDRGGSKASLRVICTPAVVWIWIGGLVVMMGGLMALAL